MIDRLSTRIAILVLIVAAAVGLFYHSGGQLRPRSVGIAVAFTLYGVAIFLSPPVSAKRIGSKYLAGGILLAATILLPIANWVLPS